MVDTAFSWPQFLWTVLVFVAVPTAIGAGAVWLSQRREPGRIPPSAPSRVKPAVGGTLTVWSAGLIAFVLGFLSCAGWLSWSADSGGRFRGPSLPAPTQFPPWQVLACAATVIAVCFFSAHLARPVRAGGLAAAVGTAAGFTTAFSVAASMDETGQAAVGVVLSVIGWGASLSALMLLRARWSTRRRGGAA